MTPAFVLYGLWAISLAAMLFWVMSLRGWRAVWGTAAYFALAVAGALAIISALGAPVPREWRPDLTLTNAVIEGVEFDEPNAIYLMLKHREGAPPIVIRRAWDEAFAKSLYRALRKAAQDGQQLAIDEDAQGIPHTHPRAFNAPAQDKDAQP